MVYRRYGWKRGSVSEDKPRNLLLAICAFHLWVGIACCVGYWDKCTADGRHDSMEMQNGPGLNGHNVALPISSPSFQVKLEVTQHLETREIF